MVLFVTSASLSMAICWTAIDLSMALLANGWVPTSFSVVLLCCAPTAGFSSITVCWTGVRVSAAFCWVATDFSVGLLVIWGFEGRYVVVPKGLLEGKKGWGG